MDAADLDGDGRDELLIGQPKGISDYIGGVDVSDGRAFLLRWPFEAGLLEARASTTTSGFFHLDSWGYQVALLPTANQLAVGTSSALDHTVWSFDVPPPGVHLEGSEWTGRVRGDNTIGVPVALEDCTGVTGSSALCVGSHDSIAFPEESYNGVTFIIETPLVGTATLDGAWAQLVGEPSERAHVLFTKSDLTADGQPDLLVGAFFMGGDASGGAYLVSSPPGGVHRLADIATATVAGSVPESEAGIGLAAGDLDGDGQDDLFLGAPIGDSGHAFVLTGPLQGDLSTNEAQWHVTGDRRDQWVGRSGVIGDVDGDGSADLVVGAPSNYYLNQDPGRVLVYASPAPGALTEDDATWLLAGRSTTTDQFGSYMVSGDFDGDDLLDLAIGAHFDSTVAPDAGSVHVILGSAWH